MSIVAPTQWVQIYVYKCVFMCPYIYVCVCVCTCAFATWECFSFEMFLSPGFLQGPFSILVEEASIFPLCLVLFFSIWNVSLDLYKLNHWQ